MPSAANWTNSLLLALKVLCSNMKNLEDRAWVKLNPWTCIKTGLRSTVLVTGADKWGLGSQCSERSLCDPRVMTS